ncbi:hypothetical protein HDU98_000066 [Podochytrium sp. JEL0797]|nr:hypothetical protein HDU98_000066 [Podochytrium sp. JEL0797]
MGRGTYTIPLRSPFSATSVQEFWGSRWNLPFSESMRVTVFTPLIKTLSGKEYKHGSKPSRWVLVFASLAVFFVSGVWHEWVLLQAFGPREHAYLGTSTIYFLIQFALVTITVAFKRVGVTWGNGWIGNCVGWVVTMSLLVMLSPLFVRPYAMGDAHLQFPLPNGLVWGLQEFL